MGWFQRYGIPGAYFWLIVIIWTLAFWHCNFDALEGDIVNILGGIIVISFTPVGYILTIITQIVYLWREGIDAQARKKAKANAGLCSNKEWKQEADSVIQIMKLYKKKEEGSKFVCDWMVRRMDVIVISRTLICASPLGIVGAMLFPWISKWDWQPNWQWILFALILTIFVMTASIVIMITLWRQLVKIEREVFEYMANGGDLAKSKTDLVRKG